ncbi:sensor histidine kinase [Streptomyces aureoverticillatus]|uniref:sensor histidine kinase n=1 Tax=Streptomyces aureoverticillatus TaxID=66871 RepID=UPI0013DB611B|nr:histidine kinase [Streptomyces aureoverticillatus]QIB47115.1 two-component sensor histidine kinase [Streptomyces aureoverticillatus]
MPRFLRPLTRAVTYTRWLHVLVGCVAGLTCASVYGMSEAKVLDLVVGFFVLPVPLGVAAGLVPAMRRAEGLQARLMLFPGAHARGAAGPHDAEPAGPGVSVMPSASWNERCRTALWLVLRIEAGSATGFVTFFLMGQTLASIGAAAQERTTDPALFLPALADGPWWTDALLVPAPLLILLGFVVAVGHFMAAVAGRLLGPSPAQRLAALEERTEQLLERNRIARELHDSLGHALTVAVVQAGAARAAADPEFTDRALEAIEDTGRHALEDLDRVLRILREDGQPGRQRPTLADADRLLDSARTSGVKVEAEVTGPVDRLPGPVSREGYRMLQEALTNVLRHAGQVPVRVQVAADDGLLTLDVRNTLPAPTAPTGRGGSGLRGIRERATLLGGRAHTGPHDGDWRVRVELPLA